MKPVKVIASILSTAILCVGFASCSENKQQDESPSFKFDYNPVVTNGNIQEDVTQPSTEESTTALAAENEPSEAPSEPEVSSTAAPTAAPTTAKPTTTRKPYTFPTFTEATQPTTQVPTTESAPTTASTTNPTTTESSTSLTLPVEPIEPLALSAATYAKGRTSQASDLFNEVNAERTKAGRTALTYSSELSRAAETRSEELAQSYSHTRPDGSAWYTADSRALAENIAYGYETAESVMNSWMNSAGHKANILNDNYTSVGIGVFFDEATDTYFWVQLFG